MVERLNKLLTVKSIVTLLATIVFCVLSLRGTLDENQAYLTVYTTIIAFYFGTQKEKNNSESEGK